MPRTGTDRSPLTGDGHEPVEAAAIAVESREAAGEPRHRAKRGACRRAHCSGAGNLSRVPTSHGEFRSLNGPALTMSNPRGVETHHCLVANHARRVTDAARDLDPVAGAEHGKVAGDNHPELAGDDRIDLVDRAHVIREARTGRIRGARHDAARALQLSSKRDLAERPIERLVPSMNSHSRSRETSHLLLDVLSFDHSSWRRRSRPQPKR